MISFRLWWFLSLLLSQHSISRNLLKSLDSAPLINFTSIVHEISIFVVCPQFSIVWWKNRRKWFPCFHRLWFSCTTESSTRMLIKNDDIIFSHGNPHTHTKSICTMKEKIIMGRSMIPRWLDKIIGFRRDGGEEESSKSKSCYYMEESINIWAVNKFENFSMFLNQTEFWCGNCEEVRRKREKLENFIRRKTNFFNRKPTIHMLNLTWKVSTSSNFLKIPFQSISSNFQLFNYSTQIYPQMVQWLMERRSNTKLAISWVLIAHPAKVRRDLLWRGTLTTSR